MLGDPVLLLIPLVTVAVVILAVLGLGAPGHAEVIVPALPAPPLDSFQDIGVIALAGHSGAGAWVARVIFAAFRAGAFALIAALAIARARGEHPDTGAALRGVAGRARSLAVLGAISFTYALLVSQQANLDATRDAGTAGTALLFGMLFLPGAFVAVIADGLGPWRALGRSARWVLRRPLGHLLLVILYGAALNGLYRLATFGEAVRPRSLPLTLYAFAGGIVTAVFVAAMARRYVLLSSPPSGDPDQTPSRPSRQDLRQARRKVGVARRARRNKDRADRRTARAAVKQSIRTKAVRKP